MGCLRLFLALSVVITHSSALFGFQMMPGGTAVPIFFMISGFYMSLVLTGKYQGVQHIWTFYSNRLLRLYPTYFIALGLTLAVYLVTAHPGAPEQSLLIQDLGHRLAGTPALSFLPLVGVLVATVTLFGGDVLYLFRGNAQFGWAVALGQVPPQPGIGSLGSYLPISPTWSIGMEICFYLLIPFMVSCRLTVLTAIAVASLSLHFAMDLHRPWSAYFFFPANFGFFLIGVIGQRLWTGLRPERRLPTWMIAAVAACGLAMLMLREFIPFYRNYAVLIYSVAAVSIPFIFHISKAAAWDRWIGNLSYPVYVLHTAAIIFCSNVLHKQPGWIVAGLSLVVACVVMLVLEEPLERFRAKRLARTQRPSSSSASQ